MIKSIKNFFNTFKYNTILNYLFLIFGILKFGILIYGFLKNIFSLDVLIFPSDSSLYIDNPNSDPTEPTGPTEPTNTGPAYPANFTEPTGATEFDIYLANRPKVTEVDWIIADIQETDPKFYEWLNQNPISMGKEVNFHFFRREGKFAAFKAGHSENSPGFNEYIERYTAYYMKLTEKYGYFKDSGIYNYINLWKLVQLL
jgi:hypothetical protein